MGNPIGFLSNYWGPRTLAQGFATGSLAARGDAFIILNTLQAGLETRGWKRDRLYLMIVAYHQALAFRQTTTVKKLGFAIAQELQQRARRLDKILARLAFPPRAKVDRFAGFDPDFLKTLLMRNPQSEIGIELQAMAAQPRGRPRHKKRRSGGMDQGSNVRYVMDIQDTTTLPADNFQRRLEELMKGRRVVSFGEEHDENRDQSFRNILRFEQLILHAYSYRRHERWRGRSLDFADLLEFLGRNFDSLLVNDFIQFLQDMTSIPLEAILRQPASRIFALVILPLSKRLGYTDVVVEGLYEEDPWRTIERSKDRIGMLLKILTGLICDLNIRGAYDENFLQPGVGVALAFQRRVNAIFDENPSARVVTYSGGAHNLTKPIKGTWSFGPITIDLSQFTFAPAFQQRWGQHFLSIDLVTRHTADSKFNSTFAELRRRAAENVIREVNHSRGQIAFVFPK